MALLQIALPAAFAPAVSLPGESSSAAAPGDVILVRLGSWAGASKADAENGQAKRTSDGDAVAWRASEVPQSVAELLSSPRVVAVGVGVANDLRLLLGQWPGAFAGRSESGATSRGDLSGAALGLHDDGAANLTPPLCVDVAGLAEACARGGADGEGPEAARAAPRASGSLGLRALVQTLLACDLSKDRSVGP